MSLNEQTLDWDLLRGFLAVVEAGSLTRAARKLSVSQPTLSRQIAALESAVGAPLFERTARGLVPTPAGLSLTEPAQHMRSAVRNAAASLAHGTHEIAGTIRLTASEVISGFVLPELLTALARRHPDVAVELIATDHMSNLLERDADIAIRMVRPAQGSLLTRHIADWPLGVYAHPSYLASVGGQVDVNRIAQYRWIGQDQGKERIEGFAAAGFEVNHRFFQFRCDNEIVSMQALRAGLGIGIAPVPLAQRWGLTRLLSQYTTPTLPIWLTAHRELRSSGRLRTVFTFLGEELPRWVRRRPARRGHPGGVREA